jgi:O-antigen ligase
VTARVELPTRALQAALLLLAALVGLLAGIHPLLAVVVAFGVAFIGVTAVNLTAGVVLFAVLTFVEEVIAQEASSTGVISFPKLIGLLLVLSWLATVTVGDPDRRNKVFSHPWLVYVAVLFLGWVSISASWAEESSPVLESAYRYGPNVMLFLIVFAAVRTRQQAIWIAGAFVVGALVSAVYGLVSPLDPAATDRLSGGAGNANETAAALVAGAALAAALSVALRGQPVLRLAATIGVPLCAYGVFLTLSRGGLVAFAAALVAAVAVAGRWRLRAIALTLVAVVATVVYFGAFASSHARDRVTKLEGGTGRSDLWTVAWRMVEDEPLRGIGAGNFQVASIHYLVRPGTILRDDFIVDKPKVTHNTYLQVLSELGVVGLALFLVIIAFSLVCTVRAAQVSERAGDLQLEVLSRALFVALIGLLAAAFFGSRQYSKQLWFLLSLGPALLAVSRAQLESRTRTPLA